MERERRTQQRQQCSGGGGGKGRPAVRLRSGTGRHRRARDAPSPRLHRSPCSPLRLPPARTAPLEPGEGGRSRGKAGRARHTHTHTHAHTRAHTRTHTHTCSSEGQGQSTSQFEEKLAHCSRLRRFPLRLRLSFHRRANRPDAARGGGHAESPGRRRARGESTRQAESAGERWGVVQQTDGEEGGVCVCVCVCVWR